MLCNVQQKIQCVFESVVVHETSTKRAHQPYKVVAGESIQAEASNAGLGNARVTEKIDGTCVYIDKFNGSPWLWARHDRKPNKAADKRFKRHQNAKRLLSMKVSSESERNDLSSVSDDLTKPTDFSWDLDKDFKDVPEMWTPASGISIKDGIAQPDANGHIPGWVPVEQKSRQYCWHLSAINLDHSVALVLQPQQSSLGDGDCDNLTDMSLEIVCRSLEELCGCTMELIGTNINGNPYRLGTKEKPLHLLVRHGSIPVNIPAVDRVPMVKFFEEEVNGQIEGIVWHCSTGDMFKLHRHHLQLAWPVFKPRLLTLPVSINMHVTQSDDELFTSVRELDSKTFKSLSDINK